MEYGIAFAIADPGRIRDCLHMQGSKNLFCVSRRLFRTEPGRHFSGRIFFQLGRNRAPRLKALGAKKRSFL